MDTLFQWPLEFTQSLNVVHHLQALGSVVLQFVLRYPIICFVNTVMVGFHVYLFKTRNRRSRACCPRINAPRIRTAAASPPGKGISAWPSPQLLSQSSLSPSPRRHRTGLHFLSKQVNSKTHHISSRRVNGRSAVQYKRRGLGWRRGRPDVDILPRLTSHGHVMHQYAGSRPLTAVTTDEDEASTLNEVTWTNEPSSLQFKVCGGVADAGGARCRLPIDKLSDVAEETERTTSQQKEGDGDVGGGASQQFLTAEEGIYGHDGDDGCSQTHGDYFRRNGSPTGRKNKLQLGAQELNTETCYRQAGSVEEIGESLLKGVGTYMKVGSSGHGLRLSQQSKTTTSTDQRRIDCGIREKIRKEDFCNQSIDVIVGIPKTNSATIDISSFCKIPNSERKEASTYGENSEETRVKQSRERNPTSEPTLNGISKLCWVNADTSKPICKSMGKSPKTHKDRISANSFASGKGRNLAGAQDTRRGNLHEEDRADPGSPSKGPYQSSPGLLKRRERGNNVELANTPELEQDKPRARATKQTTKKPDQGHRRRRGLPAMIGCKLTRGVDRPPSRNTQMTPGVVSRLKQQQQRQEQHQHHWGNQKQQVLLGGDSKIDLGRQQQVLGPSGSSQSVCSSAAERPLMGNRSDVTLVGKRDSWIWFSHETKPSVENFASRQRRFQSEDPRVAELAAEIRRQDEMNRAIEREAVGSISDIPTVQDNSGSNELVMPTNTATHQTHPASCKVRLREHNLNKPAQVKQTVPDHASKKTAPSSGRELTKNRQAVFRPPKKSPQKQIRQLSAKANPPAKPKENPAVRKLPSDKEAVTVVGGADGSFPGVLVSSPVRSSSTSSPMTAAAPTDNMEEGQKPPSPSRSMFHISPARRLQTSPRARSGECPGLSGLAGWEEMSCASTKASTSSLLGRKASEAEARSRNSEKHSSPGGKTHSHVYPAGSPPKTHVTPLESNTDPAGSSISFSFEKSTTKYERYKREKNKSPQGDHAPHFVGIKRKTLARNESERRQQGIWTSQKEDKIKSPHTQSLTTSTMESSDSMPREKLSTLRQVVIDNEVKDSVCKILFDAEKSTSSTSPTRKLRARHRRHSTLSPVKSTAIKSPTQRSPKTKPRQGPRASDLTPPEPQRSWKHRRSFSNINVFNRNYYLGSKRTTPKPSGTSFRVRISHSPTLDKTRPPAPLSRSPAQLISTSPPHTRQTPSAPVRGRFSKEATILSTCSVPHHGNISENKSLLSASQLSSSCNTTAITISSFCVPEKEDIQPRQATTEIVKEDTTKDAMISSPIDNSIASQEGIINVKQPALLDDDSDQRDSSISAPKSPAGANHRESKQRDGMNDNIDQPSNVANDSKNKMCSGTSPQHQSVSDDECQSEVRRSLKQSRLNTGKEKDGEAAKGTSLFAATVEKAFDESLNHVENNMSPDNNICGEKSHIRMPQQPQVIRYCNMVQRVSVSSHNAGPQTKASNVLGQSSKEPSGIVTTRARIRRFRRSTPIEGCEKQCKSRSNVRNRLHISISELQSMENGTTKKRPAQNLRELAQGDANENHLPLCASDNEDKLHTKEQSPAGCRVKVSASFKNMKANKSNRRHIPVSTLISDIPDLSNGQRLSPGGTSFGSQFSLDEKMSDLSLKKHCSRQGERSAESINCSEASEKSCDVRRQVQNVSHLRKTRSFYGKDQMRITRAVGFIHNPTQVMPAQKLLESAEGKNGLENQASSKLLSAQKRSPYPSVADSKTELIEKSSKGSFDSKRNSGSSISNLHQHVEKRSVDTCKTRRSRYGFQTDTSGAKVNTDEEAYDLDPEPLETAHETDVGQGGPRLSGKHGESASTNNSSNNVSHTAQATHVRSYLSAQTGGVRHHKVPVSMQVLSPSQVYRVWETDQVMIPLSYWPEFKSQGLGECETDIGFLKLKQDAKANSCKNVSATPDGRTDNLCIQKRQIICKQNVSSSLRRAHALAKIQRNVISTTKDACPNDPKEGCDASKYKFPASKLRIRSRVSPYLTTASNTPNAGYQQRRSILTRSTLHVGPVEVPGEDEHQFENSPYDLEPDNSNVTTSHHASKVAPNTEEVFVFETRSYLTKGNQPSSNLDSGYDETMSTTEAAGDNTCLVSTTMPCRPPSASVCTNGMSEKGVSYIQRSTSFCAERQTIEIARERSDTSFTTALTDNNGEIHNGTSAHKLETSLADCTDTCEDTYSVILSSVFNTQTDLCEATAAEKTLGVCEQQPGLASKKRNAFSTTSTSSSLNSKESCSGDVASCRSLHLEADITPESADMSTSADFETDFDTTIASDAALIEKSREQPIAPLKDNMCRFKNTTDPVDEAHDVGAVTYTVEDSWDTRNKIQKRQCPLENSPHFQIVDSPIITKSAKSLENPTTKSPLSVNPSVPLLNLSGDAASYKYDSLPQAGDRDLTSPESGTPSIECLCMCASPRCRCGYKSSSESLSTDADLRDCAVKEEKDPSAVNDYTENNGSENCNRGKDQGRNQHDVTQNDDCRDSSNDHELEDMLSDINSTTTSSLGAELFKDANLREVVYSEILNNVKEKTCSSYQCPVNDPEDLLVIDPTLISLPDTSSDEEDAWEPSHGDDRASTGVQEYRKLAQNRSSIRDISPLSNMTEDFHQRQSTPQNRSNRNCIRQTNSRNCESQSNIVLEHQSSRSSLNLSAAFFEDPGGSCIRQTKSESLSNHVLDHQPPRHSLDKTTALLEKHSVLSESVSRSDINTMKYSDVDMSLKRSDSGPAHASLTEAQRRAVIARRSMAFQDLLKRF